MAGLFYELDPLAQVAVNLFHGWGYNFYRVENQLRADDQLIRAKACFLLGLAAVAVADGEAAYRREHLPAPTRMHPYPDPAAVAGAQRLEALGGGIMALKAVLETQPLPENDRMTQRFRSEAGTLAALGRCDETLIGQCDLMRSLAQGSGMALVESAGQLEEGMRAIRATLEQRAALLYGVTP